jgi:predicted HTH transcriptional regulator
MPIQDPCSLLVRLLSEPTETPWLEFKTNNATPDIIGEYISALANAAMLAQRDRAFLVYGVDDKTHGVVGTKVRLRDIKKGNENLENWLGRMVVPKLMLELIDFEYDGKNVAIIVIEPTYDRPVRFAGEEYFRIGANKKRLIDYPEHERALWFATNKRKFEHAIALSSQSYDQVLQKLNLDTYFQLTNTSKPSIPEQIIQRLIEDRFLVDDMEGRFDITNLGAILLANSISYFPSIAGKSIRIIKYVGRDKARSEFEQKGEKGYAVGFSGMMKFVMDRLPNEEQYINGVRTFVPIYPATAIREVIANALIHQDFTISGAGPIIEIYSNRVEITNTGNPLIDTDRMVDQRRSRNESLASMMRMFGLCEERGGGLDKTLIEIELQHLPAPDFVSSDGSFRVVLFGPRAFNEMTKDEKVRACFYHSVLRWLTQDLMSNASLRERFSLAPDDYQAVSGIIAEAIRRARITPADPDQGKRNARYVPYWAGPKPT